MTRSQGFTLIELLVAMVAGSLLLASLTWTLSSLGRELGSSRRTEPRQRLDAAGPVLAGLIEQAFPTRRGEQPIVAEPGRLAFVTAPPAALGPVGPVRANLQVRGDATGQGLFVSFQSVDQAAAFPASARSEIPLLQGYRQIRFEYQMAEKEELPPRLVTISLTDAEGDSIRLAAAPRLTTSGDCRFDPISLTCRR